MHCTVQKKIKKSAVGGATGGLGTEEMDLSTRTIVSAGDRISARSIFHNMESIWQLLQGMAADGFGFRRQG